MATPGLEDELEAELRKLERQMISIHGEQFEPDARPRCDTSRSATFADVATAERKRRDGERRSEKNKQSMYRDQLIKTYKPLLEEELRKIDEHLPQVGTPAHKKILTKIRTQIFVRVRPDARFSASPRLAPASPGTPPSPAWAHAARFALPAQRVELEVQRWSLEGGVQGADLPSDSVSVIADLVDAASVHLEAADAFQSSFTNGTKFW